MDGEGRQVIPISTESKTIKSPAGEKTSLQNSKQPIIRRLIDATATRFGDISDVAFLEQTYDFSRITDEDYAYLTRLLNAASQLEDRATQAKMFDDMLNDRPVVFDAAKMLATPRARLSMLKRLIDAERQSAKSTSRSFPGRRRKKNSR